MVNCSVSKLEVPFLTDPEHSTAMNQNRTATPLETALFSNTADSLMPRLSPFTFPLQGCERNFGTVNVDELNASLGLPGISKNSTMDESPIRSQTSRLPQRLPAEYGKLIGRALDKPLTANALARYLSSCKNVYPDEIITDSRDAQDIFMDSGKAEREEGRAMKIVRPPPGFRDETARNILIKETTSVPSVVMELKHRPASPAAIQNKLQSTPFRPANYVQYNVRGPSNRRRPRASTRVKRTDQGPEPSAADIYPEDANWEPSRMPFSHRERPQLGMPFVPHLAPKRDLYLDDVINWPTPAEVYMNKPPTPIPTPPLDVFENYVLPTVEDINAADDIVLGMIEQLPYVSYNTLLVFGASDTISDGCPLTPGQLDGNTYGMNFYGLALGDDWNPTVVQEGKPFHIRS